MGAMNPFLRTRYSRLRSDGNSADGGTATWETTENQSGALTWDTATAIRLRQAVENTGSATATSTKQLYCSHNGGTYFAVTDVSSVVRTIDASSGADAYSISTSNFLLTAGTGTAATGEYRDNANYTIAQNLSAGDYTEYEFGFEIIDGDVSHNDTLDFRVYYGGSAFDAYDHTPRITVNKVTTITGSGGVTLPVPTLSGSGTISRSGSGGVTLIVPTLSGSGVIGRSGSGGVTLPVPALAGTGALKWTGSGGVTLPLPTLSGSGTIAKSGSGGVTLPVPTLAGSGVISRSGSGAITLPIPTLAGSGVIGRSGSGGLTLPLPTLSGSATVGRLGSGGVTLPVPALSGTGIVERVGSGGVTLPVPTLSGTGTVTPAGGPVTGSGSITLLLPTLSGSGTVVLLNPPEPQPTGIGAVVGMRERDLAAAEAERRWLENEEDRRRAVKDAFDKVFETGELPPAPAEVSKNRRRMVAREARKRLDTSGILVRLNELQRAVDDYLAYLAVLQRKRRDDEALILLMA